MIGNSKFDPDHPPPPGLFEPRRRTALDREFGGWPEQGRIGLPIPKTDRREALGLGAKDEGYGQVSVKRAEVVKPEFQRFAPFVARRDYVPLLIEPIPASSWAASLKNLLEARAWADLRRAHLAETSRICVVCGAGGHGLECHEMWEYGRMPASGRGVQRLRAMAALCESCHEMFHPGLANVRGRGRQTAERMMKVNAWSMAEYHAWLRWADALQARRSRIEWSLDLSAVAGDALRIAPTWTLRGDGTLLSAPKRYDGGRRTSTLIVGAEWTIGEAEEPSPAG